MYVGVLVTQYWNHKTQQQSADEWLQRILNDDITLANGYKPLCDQLRSLLRVKVNVVYGTQTTLQSNVVYFISFKTFKLFQTTEYAVCGQCQGRSRDDEQHHYFYYVDRHNNADFDKLLTADSELQYYNCGQCGAKKAARSVMRTNMQVEDTNRIVIVMDKCLAQELREGPLATLRINTQHVKFKGTQGPVNYQLCSFVTHAGI